MVKKAKILIGTLFFLILVGSFGFVFGAELFPECPTGRQWDPELKKCVVTPKPVKPEEEPKVEPGAQPGVKQLPVERQQREYTNAIVIAGIVAILILFFIWYRLRKR